jgi:hypothetical protein
MSTIAAPEAVECVELFSIYSVTPTALGIVVLAAPPETLTGSGGGSVVSGYAWAAIG